MKGVALVLGVVGLSTTGCSGGSDTPEANSVTDPARTMELVEAYRVAFDQYTRCVEAVGGEVFDVAVDPPSQGNTWKSRNIDREADQRCYEDHVKEAEARLVKYTLLGEEPG